MNHLTLYLLPPLTALIAWLLCRFGLMRLKQQLVRQRAAIIISLLQSLPGNTFSPERLKEKLSDPARLAIVKPLIEQHVHTFMHIKLQEKLPVIAMFASPDMLAKIKDGLLEEIDLLLPEVIDQYAGNALSDFDIKKMIAQQAENLSPDTANAIAGSIVEKIATPLSFAAFVFGLIIGSIPLIAFYI